MPSAKQNIGRIKSLFHLFVLADMEQKSKQRIVTFYQEILKSLASALNIRIMHPSTRHADVVELVDTLDLGSSASRRESSSLSIRTI